MSYEMRNLISDTFHGGRRGNAALRDSNGEPAMCSYPRIDLDGNGFTCWQRQPGTGLYREVRSVRTRNPVGNYERTTTVGDWGPR